MQIEIYKPHEGDNVQPVEWNYAELKKWLEDGLALYRGRVYGDAEIAEAKKDAADLRKLAAKIDDRRKEMKRQYLKPYEEFEKQAKELTGLIQAQVDEIAAQVKAFDEERRACKLEQIRAIYAEIFGDLAELVPLEKFMPPKWLNVTTTRMPQIEAELRAREGSISAALSSIKALGLDSETEAHITHVYLETLDLSRALAEKTRIEDERAKLAEYERRRQEQTEQSASEECLKAYSAAAQAQDAAPVDAAQTRYTVRFWARGTEAQIRGLKAYIKGNGIEYGPVR